MQFWFRGLLSLTLRGASIPAALSHHYILEATSHEGCEKCKTGPPGTSKVRLVATAHQNLKRPGQTGSPGGPRTFELTNLATLPGLTSVVFSATQPG